MVSFQEYLLSFMMDSGTSAWSFRLSPHGGGSSLLPRQYARLELLDGISRGPQPLSKSEICFNEALNPGSWKRPAGLTLYHGHCARSAMSAPELILFFAHLHTPQTVAPSAARIGHTSMSLLHDGAIQGS